MRKHKPFTMSADPKWLETKAEQEGNGCISVGTMYGPGPLCKKCKEPTPKKGKLCAACVLRALQKDKR